MSSACRREVRRTFRYTVSGGSCEYYELKPGEFKMTIGDLKKGKGVFIMSTGWGMVPRNVFYLKKYPIDYRGPGRVVSR